MVDQSTLSQKYLLWCW